MSGLGDSGFGSAPYGIGTPNTTAGNTGKVLVDDYGTQQGSRYLNQYTRQPEFDSNGNMKGQPNVHHLVTLALLTVRGSSADPDLGMAAASGVIGNNFVAEREAAIRQALDRLVKAGLVEILTIKIKSRKPVLIATTWRDLTTTQEFTSEI